MLRHAGRQIATVRSTPAIAPRRRIVGWIRDKLAPQPQKAEETDVIKRPANVFEEVSAAVEPAAAAEGKKKGKVVKKHTSQQNSTPVFRISPRKLNMLGRQISGKPIDHAILQMQFSDKRASSVVLRALATAKDHAARYKRMDASKLVVAEAWVNKGVQPPARIEVQGRGHMGIRRSPRSRMVLVLKEGKTLEEKKAAEKKRKLARIVSASIVREDVPLRNPSSTWGW